MLHNRCWDGDRAVFVLPAIDQVELSALFYAYRGTVGILPRSSSGGTLSKW